MLVYATFECITVGQTRIRSRQEFHAFPFTRSFQNINMYALSTSSNYILTLTKSINYIYCIALCQHTLDLVALVPEIIVLGPNLVPGFRH